MGLVTGGLATPQTNKKIKSYYRFSKLANPAHVLRIIKCKFKLTCSTLKTSLGWSNLQKRMVKIDGQGT